MPSDAGALRLRAVSVELVHHPALSGVDLVVEPGVPVAVTGPSGSGKTVLCLVLAGAMAPSSGSVELDGRPLSRHETRIGLVLQHHGLVGGLTAAENVAVPLQARRLPGQEIGDRCAVALGALGLAPLAGRLVDELSGGERQRVGIARALAGDPTILVADEPTAELDPDNRAKVLDLLLRHAAAGRIVVVASDDPEVVGVFPSVVTLAQGRTA